MGVDSKVRVCNLALSFLNQGLELKDLEADRTPAGMACRNFFDIVFEKIQRDYYWPRFKRRMPLALVDAVGGREYRYAYRMPPEALFFRGFIYPVGGYWMDTPSLLPAHEIGGDAGGGLIYTNEEKPVGEFAVYMEPQFWPGDFTLCFALLLASYIAPTVTGGDQFKLGERAFQRYSYEAPRAAAAALNEQGAQRQQPSGFERIRG